jgi:hypothetical protein
MSKNKKKHKHIEWADVDDDDEVFADMPGLDNMDIAAKLTRPAPPEPTLQEPSLGGLSLDDLEGVFEDIEDEQIRDMRENMDEISHKPLGDIVTSEYKTGKPFSYIARDRKEELDDFVADEHTQHLDTYLRSCETAGTVGVTTKPAFLVLLMQRLGLVSGHLQHQVLGGGDCLVVDVLVRNLGRLEDVNLSTTAYLVFELITPITEKPMEMECTLVNHIFDMRRVSTEEQVLGKIGEIVNK